MVKAERVEFFLFGDFKLIINGIDKTDKIKQSPKKLLLLEYLILNASKAVPVATLLDLLWENSDSLTIENSLKTLVSRLRKDLAEIGLDNAILTHRGAYAWNADIDCSIDVFKLKDLCTELEKVEVLDSRTREMFDEVMYLYEDDVLAHSTMSAEIPSKVYYYRDLYFKTIYRYIELLKEDRQFNQIIRVCKTALEIDSFDTTLNIELMKSLLAINKSKEALSQYRNLTNMYYIHMGAKPAEEITNFYKELINHVRSAESTIETIHTDLVERAANRGAFVCDYSIFQDIYNLNMRNLKRHKITMFLAVVSIQSSEISNTNPIQTDKAMRNLLEVIQQNLRSGDTIARYSLNQYALLLPNITNYDVARIILKRMQSIYYTDSSNAKFKFDFHIMKMQSD